MVGFSRNERGTAAEYAFPRYHSDLLYLSKYAAMSRIYEQVDAAYAAKCSDVTICSNVRGFFRELAEDAVAMAGDWVKTLETLQDSDRLHAVQQNEQIMSALSEVWSRIQPLHRCKDTRVAMQRRLAAQAALRDGDVTQALALASQAVLRAPATGDDEAIEGGVTLALCLWQRSEVLMKNNKPEAALEDLKLALKERLPAKMRSLYYWRMGHCYRDANEPTKAKVSYELASRLFPKNDASISQLKQDIESLDYSVEQKPPSKDIRRNVSLTGGAKMNMPSLSKLINIVEEQDKGRFAVANSPIKTGDVLLIDSPYAACLMSDNYSTHCLHCFQRLEDISTIATIWCPKCSGVAFCSIQCRDAAVSSYHQYECSFSDLFIGSGMSILSHIALRMVTQAGLDTSLSIHAKYISNDIKTVECSVLNDIEGCKKTKMKSRKERLNRAKKGLKNFADKNLKEEEELEPKQDDKMTFEEKLELKAAQMYSLCTHNDQRKGGDFLKRIIMAMFLTECLKRTEFFKKCDKENLKQAETSICELLIRNLQLLQFNAHEIYETLRGPHMFSKSRPNYIAVGIYPTGALLNHECYPAIARYFEGDKIVLRATRPLAIGEIVSENYGPHFLLRTHKQRQRSVASRYWFRCECIACKEDWPILKQMSSNDAPYIRCPNLACSGKFRGNVRCLPSRCGKCSTHIDKELVHISLETIDRSVEKYQEAARLMDAEKPEEATNAFCEALEQFYTVGRPPHHDTHLAQESLRSCFAAYGNVHIVRSDDQSEQKPELKAIDCTE